MDAPPLPAAGLSAADIVRLWPLSRRRPAAERVLALLVAVDGRDTLGYPLGTRNQRLLGLHQMLVRRPIEAHVVCPGCRTDNEFTLPVQAVTALAHAERGAAVRLDVDGVESAFRLPVLSDLATADSLHALAVRTCLEPAVPQLSDGDLDRLAEAWEVLDPAGSLLVDLCCASCGHGIAAEADPADFVARDLDGLVDELMRDVDVIAGGYGWSEESILALPAARRRRYVELISETRSPARRRAARP